MAIEYRFRAAIGFISAAAMVCLAAEGGAVVPQAPDSLTVRFYAKVYLLPSLDAPLMGIEADGGRVPVYRRKGAWTQIGFRNATGWLYSESPVAPEQTSAASQTDPLSARAGSARTFLLLMGGIFLALILIATGLWLLHRNRRKARSSPSAAQESGLTVVLLAKQEKIIESGIPGVFISLEKVFRDIGFNVVSAKTVSACSRLLAQGAPAVLGIDGRFSPKVFRDVHAMRGRGRSPAASLLFFYNVARPLDIDSRVKLPQAVHLGEGFTSRQVMEIIAPVFELEEKAASISSGRSAGNGRDLCALQGKVVANGLAEILQFLEVGRRTGMLSVEDGQPAGVINFDYGVITFAQTQVFEGPDAVLEILSMREGSFHFFSEKRVRQSNCRLSAFEILLHWAHRLDETGKFPVYSDSPAGG